MSLFTIIGGVLSAAAAAIGPVLSKAVTFLATKLPVVLDTAAFVVNVISTVATKVSEILNIAPPNENPEELGAKTIQAGTRPKGPEESTREYLDYLRNEVSFDEEKFNSMTIEEKLNCEVIGDTMLFKSIEEKTGVEIPGEFILAIPQANLQYQTVLSLIKSFSDAGIPSLNEYIKYISNNMSESESRVVGDAVKNAFRETYPEMSHEDIQREIIAMKREYNTEKF